MASFWVLLIEDLEGDHRSFPALNGDGMAGAFEGEGYINT
jgi:hypothetical protein